MGVCSVQETLCLVSTKLLDPIYRTLIQNGKMGGGGGVLARQWLFTWHIIHDLATQYIYIYIYIY